MLVPCPPSAACRLLADCTHDGRRFGGKAPEKGLQLCPQETGRTMFGESSHAKIGAEKWLGQNSITSMHSENNDRTSSLTSVCSKSQQDDPSRPPLIPGANQGPRNGARRPRAKGRPSRRKAY